MTAPGKGIGVNKARCCEIFSWTRQQFDAHVRDGMPVAVRPATRGGDYLIYTGEIMAWLLGRAISAEGDETPDFNRERARLTKEQADKIALENGRLRSELLPAGDVLEGWQAAIGRTRALLLRIPYATAPDVIRAAKSGQTAVIAVLTDAIHGALGELANTRVDDLDDDEAEAGDAGDAGGGHDLVAASARSLAKRVGRGRISPERGRGGGPRPV